MNPPDEETDYANGVAGVLNGFADYLASIDPARIQGLMLIVAADSDKDENQLKTAEFIAGSETLLLQLIEVQRASILRVFNEGDATVH